MGAGAIACCAALAVGIAGYAGHASTAGQVPALRLVQRVPAHQQGRDHERTEMVAITSSLRACEARLEAQPRRVPTLAIVGASFTAGLGPDNPELSWAVVLARLLRWNAVIFGVSGVGYVAPGTDNRGPVESMLSQERLRGLAPSVVIVQAGHDDVGQPAASEMPRVDRAVDLVQSAAPSARVALITVFTDAGLVATPALRAIDHAIVTAGKAADRRIIIMDPLTGRWRFPRERPGGLHPSAAGDVWIAHKVADILAAHGVQPASVGATVPVICDVAVGVTKPPTDTDRDT
jgi:lysophospholipase L1-like esterase